MGKQSILHQKLEQFDVDGVSVHDAKQALLRDGYSESEISIAAASSPFDGKRNGPRELTDEEKFYRDNPEAAKHVAKTLLEHDNARRQQDARLSAAAAAATRHNLGSYHPASLQATVSLSERLGIPLFGIVGVGIFIAACLYGLHVTGFLSIDVFYWYLKVSPWVVGIIFVVTFILSQIRFSKNKNR